MSRAACAVVLVVGCHSAGIVVEHRGAGGVEVDHAFVPRLGADGHYISFPAHPFVNCVDAALFDYEADHHQAHSPSRKQACSDSSAYSSFVGYRTPAAAGPEGVVASWITPATDSMFDGALRKLAKELHTGPLQEPRAEFSFLHFSDVQIREPAAKLTNASAALDKIIGTFQRDYEQELYSRYTYASLIDTVNAELSLRHYGRPAPLFMIHTGDSVDAGLKSEFDDFLSNSNRLQIPWYQALGNHDVLAFGNLKLYSQAERDAQKRSKRGTGWSKDGTVVTDADCTVGDEECSCTQVADLLRDVEYEKDYDNLGNPVEIPASQQLASIAPALLRRICLRHRVYNDRFIMDPTEDASDLRPGCKDGTANPCHLPVKASNAFMAAHCERSNGKCIPHEPTFMAYAASNTAKQNPCGTLDGDGPRSVLHGFDLQPTVKSVISAAKADEIRRRQSYIHAHYCFEAADLGGRKVWAIVLDTNAPNGAYGDVSKQQLDWLEAVLGSKQLKSDTDLIMLFGHHPFGHIFSVDRRARLLDMLTSDDRVIGYFAGHTHEPELRVIHSDSKHHHFWEIIAPSVISYPQQVRQVTLKTMGDELAYFEILTFAPQGEGPSADKAKAAMAGAQRDTCNGSKDCENGMPKLVSRATTYSRLFFRLPQAKAVTAPATP